MPPHELHPLVPKPQSFLVWCFCFLGTIASVRKLILRECLLFRNPQPFGVGWNQGWGSISREGEGKERMGREGHWQKLLLVFLLMCVKYFENVKKKILQPSAADLMFSHLSIPLSPYSFDYCIQVHFSWKLIC